MQNLVSWFSGRSFSEVFRLLVGAAMEVQSCLEVFMSAVAVGTLEMFLYGELMMAKSFCNWRHMSGLFSIASGVQTVLK
jgi:hypothetical protein